MHNFFLPQLLQSFATTDRNQVPTDVPQVFMEQVHGNSIHEVSNLSHQCALNVDAMWTRHTELQLIVRVADCVPILFYGANGVIGVIHAGRRGTQAHITEKTLRQVLEQTGAQQIWCWIGPHICQKCYEVNRETHQHFDLQGENISQINAVSPQAKVHIQGDCTFETQRWHSYRREGKGKPMNYFGVSLS